MKRSRLFVVPIVAALILAGCGSDGDTGSDSASNETVTVYTVPGLKDVVTKTVDKYKDENPDTKVTVSAASRVDAITAIKNKQVAVVVLPKNILDRVQGTLPNAGFGRNLLVLAVPTDNPGNVTSMQGFWSDGVRRGSCILWVPPDCKSKVLKQLADGDIDAALLFRAELEVPKGVKVITLPDQPNLVIDVTYAVSGGTPAAISLGKFMATPAARAILTENGYLP